MSFKIKVEQYVDWGIITVDELRAQIALGALPRVELQKLLVQHLLSDLVTGWVYKYLYVRRDIFGERVDNKDKFTF